MSTPQTPVGARLPFRRCPSCGALDWPPHEVTHRPRCPHEDSDPATWDAPKGNGGEQS